MHKLAEQKDYDQFYYNNYFLKILIVFYSSCVTVMSYIPKYENDGSGRDTFINYAGAYWLNPLPGGRYYKSAKAHGNQWENSCS